MVNLNKGILILLFLVIVIVQVVGAAEPPIVPSFTASPTSGVAPLTVQFTDTSTGNPSRWQWRFGDGISSLEQNPIHIFSPGTYSVTLEEAGANGIWLYTSTQTTIIVVKAPPAPVASFTANPISGTAPLTVQFTDTSTGNPIRWQWYFDDMASLGYEDLRQNPSHVFNYRCGNERNSVYEVRLTSSDRFGNSSTATKNIQILEIPPNAVPAFTATPLSGPAPLTVQFRDTSTGNPNMWSWFFGDGTVSNSQNPPAHEYTISGVYTVQMYSGLNIKTDRYFCNLYEPKSTNTIITVLSPLYPNATATSPTPAQTTITTTTTAPNTTVTTTTTTVPTTTTTVLTTAPIVTTSVTPIPSPTTKATVKVTVTKATPWPNDTPIQSTPLGIEIGIIATICAVLLVMRRK